MIKKKRLTIELEDKDIPTIKKFKTKCFSADVSMREAVLNLIKENVE